MGTPSNVSLLPFLTFIEIFILAVLLKGKNHGFGIIQAIAVQSNNTLILSAGTLYTALKRLHREGLIIETSHEDPEAKGNSERRRYYEITNKGIQVITDDITKFETTATEVRALLQPFSIINKKPPDRPSMAIECIKELA